MTVSNFFDDLANNCHLDDLLTLAGKRRPLELEQFRRLAYARAEKSNIEKHGDHWVRTLIDFAERAGIGQLTRDSETGELRFVPASDLPSAEQAWERVWASGLEQTAEADAAIG